jgi:predicted enzyme related to lactoylglutathione lyase
MSTSHGQFVWYDLVTTDIQAALEFYGRVIGWTARDPGIPGQSYMVLSAGEAMMGGVTELPQQARDMGGRPGWLGYIGVDDVDATASRVTAAGGGIHRPGTDIPGIGRFAIVHDPQGAAFMLFRGMDGQAPDPAGATPGRIGWHELSAVEHTAAFAFYADLFGWTLAEAIPMGPLGVYQLFAIGGTTVGGMLNRVDANVPPHWLYYINVDAIEPAIDRVKDAGGTLVRGPHPVPGGSHIAHCLDPQGGLFALVAPK